MPKAIRARARSRGSSGFGVAVWRDLPARRASAAWLGAGLALNGAGHGVLAFAAGMLTRSLAQPRAASGEGLSLLNVCYVGLGAACVKAAGSALLAHAQARAAGGVALAWRRRFVEGWSERGLPDVAPRVLATVAVRLAELEAAVTQGALGAARALAQLAPIVLGLILVSPRLAAVGTLVLVPFGLALAALRRRLRRASDAAQARAVALHQGVDELVRNLDLWRTFGATRRVATSLEATGAVAVAASARVEAWRAALSGGNEVLGALALVASVAIAERAGAPLGDGTLAAFAAVCFMAYRPLRDLGDARGWMARGGAALEALEGVMTEVEAPVGGDPPRASSRSPRNAGHAPSGAAQGGEGFAKRHGLLELHDFGARDRGPRTSLRVPFGETVAIVGANGSGKTTLLRALLGLEPAVGRVVFAGVDLTRAGVGPDHRPFAWVPQDAPLVTGSVLENVALACGDATRARLALAELGAERLLARAGERVGPGGTALSGGERRLIALGRALATDLPVLLLDEPTEGLDAKSRARVLQAIRGLAGSRTLLLVTHHADVARVASRVVVLGGPSALAAE